MIKKYNKIKRIDKLFTYKLTSVQNIEMLQFSPKSFFSPIKVDSTSFLIYNNTFDLLMSHITQITPKTSYGKNYNFAPRLGN